MLKHKHLIDKIEMKKYIVPHIETIEYTMERVMDSPSQNFGNAIISDPRTEGTLPKW